MKLYPLGANMTEVVTAHAAILFSYQTPVAAYSSELGYLRTSKHWSSTTSRHINKWFKGMNLESKDAREMGQEFFDSLTLGVK